MIIGILEREWEYRGHDLAGMDGYGVWGNNFGHL